MSLLRKMISKKSILLLVLLALSLPLFSIIPDWDMTKTYVKGNEVVFDGEIWRAKWWNLNEVPGRFEDGAWEEIEDVYDYSDDLAPSRVPPGGLKPEETPMFVVLSSDDNFNPDGLNWVLDYIKDKESADGSDIEMTFFHPISSLWMQSITDSWMRAMDEGHEVANHTYDHGHGSEYSVEKWVQQIADTTARLIAPRPYGLGAFESEIKGFRAPFAEYNGNLMKALREVNMLYDTTVMEGLHGTEDGTNFYWPYTLNHKSPGHDLKVQWGAQKPMDTVPGLWEIPIYAMLTPTDEECVELGIEPGLRDRCAAKHAWYANGGYKITGVDWNIIYSFQLTPDEHFALLKYNFDKRINGNRAPFNYVIHSNYYADPVNRIALAKFIDYALTHKDVRFVTTTELIEWMRDPEPLDD